MCVLSFPSPLTCAWESSAEEGELRKSRAGCIFGAGAEPGWAFRRCLYEYTMTKRGQNSHIGEVLMSGSYTFLVYSGKRLRTGDKPVHMQVLPKGQGEGAPGHWLHHIDFRVTSSSLRYMCSPRTGHFLHLIPIFLSLAH